MGILFFPAVVFAGNVTDESYSNWIRFFQSIDTFVADTRQAIQSAQAEPRGDAGKLNWANAIFWDEKNVSPLSGTAGSSVPIQTDFGSVQMYTDVVGTFNRDTVYGVVDVLIDKGWTVEKPTFDVKENTQFKSVRFFTPVTMPIKENRHKPYVINAAFPFVVHLTKPGVPMELSVDITMKACKGDVCAIKTYPVVVNLGVLKGETSPFKPFIAHAWAFMPKPVQPEEITVAVAKDDTLWVDIPNRYPMLTGEYILSSDKPVTVTEQRIVKTGTHTRLILKTTPSLKSKPVNLVFGGEKGLWEFFVPAPVEKELPMSGEQSGSSLIWVSVLFLICSPLLCRILFFVPNNEFVARHEALNTLKVFIPCGIIAAVFFGAFPSVYQNLFQSVFWIVACAVIFIVMYFISRVPTPFSCVVLTVIAPLTYLADIWNNADTGWKKAGLCLFLTGIACLPYILFYVKPRIAVLWLKRTQHWSITWKKTPLLACAVWLLFMANAISFNRKSDVTPYFKQAVEQALHENKIVLLSVGPDWCVSCTVNRVNLTYVGVAKRLIREQKVVLMTAQENPLSEDKTTPQNIIITPGLPQGQVVPSFIPDYKMESFFNAYLAQ